MADIQIPHWLWWVAYLVGPHWPKGSETEWWQRGAFARDIATALTALTPDLAEAPEQIAKCLVGVTAETAQREIDQLFAGPYSIDKIVDAVNTLSGVSDGTGTKIQSSKLGTIFMLGVAARGILKALA